MIDITNPAHLAKINGDLVAVPLSKVDEVSLSPGYVKTTHDTRRCLTPDRADAELATAETSAIKKTFSCDDETACVVQGLHRSSVARDAAKAIGIGGWPPGNQCHPTLYPHKMYHATTVFVQAEQFLEHKDMRRNVTDAEWQTVVNAKVWPTVSNPVKSVAEAKRLFAYGSETIAAFEKPEWRLRSSRKAGEPLTVLDMGCWLAFEATRRAGIYLVEIFDGPEGTRHNIHIKMIPIPGTTAGFAYFPDGSCNDHVTCNIDNLDGYTLDWFARLLTHEIGHTIDLQHEFGAPQAAHRSVMSYATVSPFQGYRKSGQPYLYSIDRSWPELTALYGGESALPIQIADPTPDGKYEVVMEFGEGIEALITMKRKGGGELNGVLSGVCDIQLADRIHKLHLVPKV